MKNGKNPKEAQQGEPRIRHARVDSLCIYEVTEDELIFLEQGSPNSLQLNFSIFLVTLGVAFLIALLTTKIESMQLFTIFIVITCLGFIIGFILFCLWLKSYRSIPSVSKKIRNRLQTEESVTEIDPEDPNST